MIVKPQPNGDMVICFSPKERETLLFFYTSDAGIAAAISKPVTEWIDGRSRVQLEREKEELFSRFNKLSYDEKLRVLTIISERESIESNHRAGQVASR